MYPGEKSHIAGSHTFSLFNPYLTDIVSPYGYIGVLNNTRYGITASYNPIIQPDPELHMHSIQQTLKVNDMLNQQAKAHIDAKEPKRSIWATEDALGGQTDAEGQTDVNHLSKLDRAKKFLHINASRKESEEAQTLRQAILEEEAGRWSDDMSRQIATEYQNHMGIARKIAQLRVYQPIQYLHLLRAGYFDPIPVAWAERAANPLMFTIDAAAGLFSIIVLLLLSFVDNHH